MLKKRKQTFISFLQPRLWCGVNFSVKIIWLFFFRQKMKYFLTFMQTNQMHWWNSETLKNNDIFHTHTHTHMHKHTRTRTQTHTHCIFLSYSFILCTPYLSTLPCLFPSFFYRISLFLFLSLYISFYLLHSLSLSSSLSFFFSFMPQKCQIVKTIFLFLFKN